MYVRICHVRSPGTFVEIALDRKLALQPPSGRSASWSVYFGVVNFCWWILRAGC